MYSFVTEDFYKGYTIRVYKNFNADSMVYPYSYSFSVIETPEDPAKPGLCIYDSIEDDNFVFNTEDAIFEAKDWIDNRD